MAIKPDDCIIKIKDLFYESYWENFLQHVKSTCPPRNNWNTYDNHLESELSKFNGVLKETKNRNNRYIKFKKQSDLAFFILKWS